MIPSTELKQAASNPSSSATGFSSYAQLSEFSTNDLQLGLGQHSEFRFDSRNESTRQKEFLQNVVSRDSKCRLCGSPPFTADAAHFFKAANPDVNLMHVLVTRAPLYTSAPSPNTFFKGKFDVRVGLLLQTLFLSRPDRNCLAFYLYPNESCPDDDDPTSGVLCLPLESSAIELLDNSYIWGRTEKLSTKQAPMRLDKPNDPLAVMWDWQFGSRFFACFGTDEAKATAAQSPMVDAVGKWRAKVARAKARKQLRHPDQA